MAETAVLYTRELPGGGFVAIESLSSDDGVHRARLSVERRNELDRRDGHERRAPPCSTSSIASPSTTWRLLAASCDGRRLGNANAAAKESAERRSR